MGLGPRIQPAGEIDSILNSQKKEKRKVTEDKINTDFTPFETLTNSQNLTFNAWKNDIYKKISEKYFFNIFENRHLENTKGESIDTYLRKEFLPNTDLDKIWKNINSDFINVQKNKDKNWSSDLNYYL